MVASAVIVTDLKGKVLISRNYRGDIPMNSSEKFSQRIQNLDECDIKPVFTENGVTYASVKQNNVYILALTKRNVNITLTLLYLYRICDVFKEYFGDITEEATHYHADSVHPYWADSLNQTVVINNHLFYK